MSMKPIVITATQVSEQTLKLTRSIREMELTVRQLENRLAAIEKSLAENDVLRNAAKKMREESLGQFQLEWKRKKEFFPDTRLAIINKTVELLTPPKKDKEKGTSSPTDPKPK